MVTEITALRTFEFLMFYNYYKHALILYFCLSCGYEKFWSHVSVMQKHPHNGEILRMSCLPSAAFCLWRRSLSMVILLVLKIACSSCSAEQGPHRKGSQQARECRSSAIDILWPVKASLTTLLAIFNFMRYIGLRFDYLLTYLLVATFWKFTWCSITFCGLEGRGSIRTTPYC